MLLYTAAKLDLAEHLASGATQVEELARKVDADPRVLLRILRALVSHGVCEELAGSRFRHWLDAALGSSGRGGG